VVGIAFPMMELVHRGCGDLCIEIVNGGNEKQQVSFYTANLLACSAGRRIYLSDFKEYSDMTGRISACGGQVHWCKWNRPKIQTI